MNYVYIFDCVNCAQFYGEQKLNDQGELLCPECQAPERIDSPFVEKMAVI
jgi:predicted nucleic acid-binding Zn ribbon protein